MSQKPLQVEEVMTKLHESLRHLALAASDENDAMDHSNSHALVPVLTQLPTASRLATTCSHSAGKQQHRRWRDFLYQHSVTSLEAIEERNMRLLQGRIPAIATTASSVPFPSSHGNSNTIARATPVRSGRKEEATRQRPSPWLHDSDPSQLNMREQEGTLYNKYVVSS
jgi:hypothetical protein